MVVLLTGSWASVVEFMSSIHGTVGRRVEGIVAQVGHAVSATRDLVVLWGHVEHLTRGGADMVAGVYRQGRHGRWCLRVCQRRVAVGVVW
jgi:hypothetical protein